MGTWFTPWADELRVDNRYLFSGATITDEIEWTKMYRKVSFDASNNIYTTDWTLTDNRTLDWGSNNLTFQNFGFAWFNILWQNTNNYIWFSWDSSVSYNTIDLTTVDNSWDSFWISRIRFNPEDWMQLNNYSGNSDNYSNFNLSTTGLVSYVWNGIQTSSFTQSANQFLFSWADFYVGNGDYYSIKLYDPSNSAFTTMNYADWYLQFANAVDWWFSVSTSPNYTWVFILDGITATRSYTFPNSSGTVILGAGSSWQVSFWNGTSTQWWDNAFFWDNTNKRLGIGTASPSSLLHIKGSGVGDVLFGTWPNNSNYLSVSFNGNLTNYNLLGSSLDNTFRVGRPSGGDLYFTEANSPQMVIRTGGNVSIGAGAASSKLEINTNSLGTTQTISSGLALVNTTAAANGAQQISPAIRFSGKGWGTTASTSQAVDFRQYALPVQGTVPTGNLTWESSINGAAYSTTATLTTTGQFWLGNTSSGIGIGAASLTTGAADVTGGAVRYFGLAGATGNSYVHYFSNTSTRVTVSGTNGFMKLTENFAPTSGTAVYSILELTPTINQTGGANGITRGIYVNPTLTAAADFRAIETSNTTGYSIYTASAPSFFGGNIIADKTVRLKWYTVATLPASPVQWDTAFVTDALAPTFLTTVVWWWAVVTTVFYNGTNWIAQ